MGTGRKTKTPKLTNRIKNALDNLSEDEEITLADGFESAFIGVARQFGKPIAIYDRGKCIQSLIKGGMAYPEAEEYFMFNTEGAWVGNNTPAFLEK